MNIFMKCFAIHDSVSGFFCKMDSILAITDVCVIFGSAVGKIHRPILLLFNTQSQLDSNDCFSNDS